ncbi:Proton-coupled amino acid transporter 4 (Proton/amino acid transporter 4) (Solute carrier family 36 member 4) [Durusdinium trenchii]|uniref:Proton-coupled amino acid transporter 4 (Proton/amino acid transporter 4) (Solute carrier family 36 member 4) n=1 Tax=Durusdinium trenchii TaxID=1381693 RepID=A0ABP0K802_9DINO
MEVHPEVIGREDISREHSFGGDEEEDDLSPDVVPSERSLPRLTHVRRQLHKHEEPTEIAVDSDDGEESTLVAHANHKDTEERPKITVWAASSNLVTCMVGASVLSLPRMVANNGWALGPGMVLLAGFVSYQACTMVDQAMDHLADTYGQHPRNIGDVVQECFGQRGRRAVLFLTCVFQISKCGVYFVVIGANLNYALDGMTQRQWALTGALLCMRLMFVQDITVISRWSFIGVIASVVYLLTISAGGVEAAALNPTPSKTWPNTYTNLLADFAVMVYAYSPCDVLPVLKHDMKEPRSLHLALRFSFFTVVFLYVSLGSVAYLGWGNQVAGNVLLSMCDPPGCPGNLPAKVDAPGKKWMLGYCLAGAVVSNLMVTAPVVLYCVFRVLEAEHTLLTQPWVNRTLRVTTVTIAVLIALFLPHFTEILAVISTGLLTLLQIFVPVAVTLALRGLGFRELLLCFLGVGMLTAGMFSALKNLYTAIVEG